MSLASMVMAGRGGRPRTTGESERYRCVFLVKTRQVAVEEAASLFRVSVRTVWRWCRECLDSDEIEAEGLRRIISKRPSDS